MKKEQIASKMIQHTHYDRKLGKLVRTMVPQSKEHAEKTKNWPKAPSKELTESEKAHYQHKIGKAYSE